jgi:hypothetical protein
LALGVYWYLACQKYVLHDELHHIEVMLGVERQARSS